MNSLQTPPCSWLSHTVLETSLSSLDKQSAPCFSVINLWSIYLPCIITILDHSHLLLLSAPTFYNFRVNDHIEKISGCFCKMWGLPKERKSTRLQIRVFFILCYTTIKKRALHKKGLKNIMSHKSKIKSGKIIRIWWCKIKNHKHSLKAIKMFLLLDGC